MQIIKYVPKNDTKGYSLYLQVLGDNNESKGVNIFWWQINFVSLKNKFYNRICRR